MDHNRTDDAEEDEQEDEKNEVPPATGGEGDAGLFAWFCWWSSGVVVKSQSRR